MVWRVHEGRNRRNQSERKHAGRKHSEAQAGGVVPIAKRAHPMYDGRCCRLWARPRKTRAGPISPTPSGPVLSALGSGRGKRERISELLLGERFRFSSVRVKLDKYPKKRRTGASCSPTLSMLYRALWSELMTSFVDERYSLSRLKNATMVRGGQIKSSSE